VPGFGIQRADCGAAAGFDVVVGAGVVDGGGGGVAVGACGGVVVVLAVGARDTGSG
jgi:hypothetical protein